MARFVDYRRVINEAIATVREALIEMTWMHAGDRNSKLIHIKVKPVFFKSNYSKTLSVFPDTGANISLLAPLSLRKLRVLKEGLAPDKNLERRFEPVKIVVAKGTLHKKNKIEDVLKW